MKILFVCFDQFPVEGACTSLLLNLFAENQIQSLGDVHILTLSASPGAVSDEICDGITVHRFCSVTRKRIKQLLAGSPKNFIASCSEILYRASQKKLSLPCCGKVFYDNVLVREALAQLTDLHRKYRFDLVIPVSGLYEAAVAALRFCKQNCIPLGLYQVDPCSTNEAMKPQSRKAREAFEKELYDFSSFVITTDIIKREVKDLLHIQDGDKIYAMEFPNIRDLKAAPREKKETDRIDCVFAGRLYPKARDPKFTFELFSGISKENIHLVLVGVDRGALQAFQDIAIPDNLTLLGDMPITQARRELEKADFLVNIGNTVSNQVPSKLFEYFSLGKPIINLAESSRCPSLKYTKRHPCCLDLVHEGDAPAELKRQTEELERFILDNFGKTIPLKEIRELFYECTPEYCSKRMKEIIEERVSAG